MFKYLEAGSMIHYALSCLLEFRLTRCTMHAGGDQGMMFGVRKHMKCKRCTGEIVSV